MHIVIGNLWDELGRADLLLVTSNSFVKRTGELVMGRGAAFEAAAMFPGLPKDLGMRLRKRADYDPHCRYGVLLATERYHPTTRLGIFQVKTLWYAMASVDLIAYAVERLIKKADAYPRIAMNYPGIGNGRLTEREVQPLVRHLPSNVFLYKKP